MYSFVLQDWTTVGGAAGSTVIQGEKDWLDMSPFQDIVAWIDVRNATTGNPPSLKLETAPSKDESLFMYMGSGTGITMVASSPPDYTPTVVQYLMGSATVPVAECLRWKIIGGAVTWQATFRILVAANAPGLQPEDENRQLLMMGR